MLHFMISFHGQIKCMHPFHQANKSSNTCKLWRRVSELHTLKGTWRDHVGSRLESLWWLSTTEKRKGLDQDSPFGWNVNKGLEWYVNGVWRGRTYMYIYYIYIYGYKMRWKSECSSCQHVAFVFILPFVHLSLFSQLAQVSKHPNDNKFKNQKARLPNGFFPKRLKHFNPLLASILMKKLGLFALFSSHKRCSVLHGVLVYGQSPQNNWTNMFLQIHQHSEQNISKYHSENKKAKSRQFSFLGWKSIRSEKNCGSNLARALFTCIIVGRGAHATKKSSVPHRWGLHLAHWELHHPLGFSLNLLWRVWVLLVPQVLAELSHTFGAPKFKNKHPKSNIQNPKSIPYDIRAILHMFLNVFDEKTAVEDTHCVLPSHDVPSHVLRLLGHFSLVYHHVKNETKHTSINHGVT